MSQREAEMKGKGENYNGDKKLQKMDEEVTGEICKGERERARE